ncbi:hypothetical protein BTJ39_17755 [Izhakiella australiensis]|uniref:Regulation of enolase 1 n=1 Tax=Izhakiella australiensis TaxID=1926881 RepID=A0A1S8YHZ8_9GAMM|nr:DUF1349 domain-containing protein [Izhakiella australiensis]OON38699.1 hypothetical protein BTJ39_17755 [Izhakiella australiensis]
MPDSFYWINEPQQWQRNDAALRVVTDENTDFWRKTWYGFERFSGHIFATDVDNDFTFQVRLRAEFTELYDQAGIMFMSDSQHWLKAGIEFNDGAPAIGSVLTLENSDWATGIFTGNPRDFWLRLTRKGDSLRLQYSSDAQHWPLLRLCHFPHGSAKVGVMCCTPERRGLVVDFQDITLTPPLDKALHDLS